MRSSLTTMGTAVLLIAGLALLSSTGWTATGEQGMVGPHPMVFNLDPAAKEYTPVLDGPPATHSMRSGYVVLAPGQSVGIHSTGGYEEVVVVFEGTGKMTIIKGPELALTRGSVAYCPPRKEHDVTNTGRQPLRYLYVVAVVPSAGKP